jgi:hypothetical protein
MTAPSVFFPLPTLVDQIAALCDQRKTGNLVLISDDNRMAQMHLLQGLIMFIMCRGRRGQDALPLMRTMTNARMSLDSNALIRNEGTAFSPASVLAYLKGTTQQLPEPGNLSDAGQAAPGAAQAPQSVARPQPVEAPAKGVSADVRHMLQAVMVRYIGPMAEIVCDEHFDADHDLHALVNALAAEIPNEAQGAAFKAEIAKSLGIAGF